MFRLIETASSALAAASLLALALGCAIIGKPSWADQPLFTEPCAGCIHGGCAPCGGDCENFQNEGCGCDCTSGKYSELCPYSVYYSCTAPP